MLEKGIDGLINFENPPYEFSMPFHRTERRLKINRNELTLDSFKESFVTVPVRLKRAPLHQRVRNLDLQALNL